MSPFIALRLTPVSFYVPHIDGRGTTQSARGGRFGVHAEKEQKARMTGNVITVFPEFTAPQDQLHQSVWCLD
jgi:hypothetical protein